MPDVSMIFSTFVLRVFWNVPGCLILDFFSEMVVYFDFSDMFLRFPACVLTLFYAFPLCSYSVLLRSYTLLGLSCDFPTCSCMFPT